MASLTIQRTDVCSGGGHHTVRLTLGAREVDVTLTIDHISGPVSEAELSGAIGLLLRAKKIGDGLSNAQLLAAAVAGITVTL